MSHSRRGREPCTSRFSGILARSFLFGLFLAWTAAQIGWAQAEQDASRFGAGPPAGIADLKALEARIQTTVSGGPVRCGRLGRGAVRARTVTC